MAPGLKVGSHARASVETANVEKIFDHRKEKGGGDDGTNLVFEKVRLSQ